MTDTASMSGWHAQNRSRKAFELALVALRLSDPLSIRTWSGSEWKLAQRSAGHRHPPGTITRVEAIRYVEAIQAALAARP